MEDIDQGAGVIYNIERSFIFIGKRACMFT